MTLVRLILIARLPSAPDRPSFDDDLQGPRVDAMELAPALPLGRQQSGRLEDVEGLRDGLPRQPEPVLHRQPTAQLEQRLAVPLLQLVQDRPPGRRGESLENVAHAGIIRKSRLAYQPQNRRDTSTADTPGP